MKKERSGPNRTVVKSCRVTLAEDRRLRKEACDEGVNMTELMRNRILRGDAGHERVQ